MISIVAKPIDILSVLLSVQDPSAGGIDLFVGTTRDHAGGRRVLSLEYEVYEPMALKVISAIAEDAKTRWGICKISVVHRTGKVAIGEASIVIGVSAAHRHEAFEACRFVIDTIKRSAPIWKKEYYADGECWVGMQG